MKNLNLLFAGCLVAASACSSFAQDWPQWRGAERDGKITGFEAPKVWPEKLTQKWKVNIGKGDSGPALVGNKLYTFGRQDTNEVIACLDSATGKSLWQVSYPADFIVTGAPAGHPGPRSSVLVTKGKVINFGVGGILSCLDASNGKVIWWKKSDADFGGFPARQETSLSPIVEKGLCIVHVGSKTNSAILAFDLSTGALKWKTETDGPSSASPAIAKIHGVKQVVVVTSKAIVGASLSDGKLLWRFPFEAKRVNCITPVVNGDVVIVDGEGRGLTGIQVALNGKEFSPSGLWTNAPLTARFTTAVLKNGKLYGYSGPFFCADAKTGATIWKSTNAPAGGNSAALIDAGSVLFALTVKGDLVAYKSSEKEYTELARFPVSDKATWAHPIISGKNIFIRDEDSVALWQL